MDDLVVAVVAGLLAGVASWIAIGIQLKNAKKERINEKQIEIYERCSRILDSNIADSKIVFGREYIDSLVAIKSEIKLFASNKVVQVFERYFLWATDLYREYRKFCIANDVTDDRDLVVTEEGVEYEVCHFNEEDLEYQEFKVQKFIDNKNLSYELIKSKALELLNAMRADLGNDQYKPVY